MKNLLLLFFLVGCAGSQVSENPDLTVKGPEVTVSESALKAQSLLDQMTVEEKKTVLKSYLTLRALSTDHLNPQNTSTTFVYGIPRLGIPSIMLVDHQDTVNRTQASATQVPEGEILKLGSVNLIRDFEKAQSYGNFSQASKVDALMGPDAEQVKTDNGHSFKLQDLDLFFAKTGSDEYEVRELICAVHKSKQDKDKKVDSKDEITCVESRFDEMANSLELKEPFAQALERGGLKQNDIDTMVYQLLKSMYELKIM